MYNGIGLATVRGSATSGYVSKNMSYIKPEFFRNKLDAAAGNFQSGQKGGNNFRVNKDVLEHNRKHALEAEIFEFEEKLRDKGISEDEIAVESKAFREKLSQQENARNSKSMTDSHAIFARKEEELKTLKNAFGIDDSYNEGDAMDEEVQEKRRIDREKERIAKQEEWKARQEKREADAKRRAEEEIAWKARQEEREAKRKADRERREAEQLEREKERETRHRERRRSGDRDRRRSPRRGRSRSDSRRRDRRHHSRDGKRARSHSKEDRDSPRRSRNARSHSRQGEDKGEHKRRRTDSGPRSPERKERSETAEDAKLSRLESKEDHRQVADKGLSGKEAQAQSAFAVERSVEEKAPAAAQHLPMTSAAPQPRKSRFERLPVEVKHANEEAASEFLKGITTAKGEDVAPVTAEDSRKEKELSPPRSRGRGDGEDRGGSERRKRARSRSSSSSSSSSSSNSSSSSSSSESDGESSRGSRSVSPTAGSSSSGSVRHRRDPSRSPSVEPRRSARNKERSSDNTKRRDGGKSNRH